MDISELEMDEAGCASTGEGDEPDNHHTLTLRG
jgi:hypothetical protein